MMSSVRAPSVSRTSLGRVNSTTTMHDSQNMAFPSLIFWPPSHALSCLKRESKLTVLDCAEGYPPKEECQERHSVLPDGVWCFWNWYATALSNCAAIPNRIRTLDSQLSLQAGPPLSTPSAASLSSSTRKPTMLPTRTLRRASRSSPLPSVRDDEPQTPQSVY